MKAGFLAVAFLFLQLSFASAASPLFYVVEGAGGPPGSGDIRTIYSDGSSTVLVSGLWTNTQIDQPWLVSYGDNIYMTNPGDGILQKITPTGVVSTFATISTGQDMSFDGSGNMYAAEEGSRDILQITPGGSVSVFSTNLQQPHNPYGSFYQNATGQLFSSGDGGLTSVAADGTTTIIASFPNLISSIQMNNAGNFYASSWTAPEIYEVNPADGSYRLFATPTGTVAQIIFDYTTNTLWALTFNGDVESIDSAGTVSVLASGIVSPGGLAFVVPEPSTWALLAISLLTFAARSRRRKIA